VLVKDVYQKKEICSRFLKGNRRIRPLPVRCTAVQKSLHLYSRFFFEKFPDFQKKFSIFSKIFSLRELRFKKEGVQKACFCIFLLCAGRFSFSSCKRVRVCAIIKGRDEFFRDLPVVSVRLLTEYFRYFI
jgi:hypothetical protein